MLPVFMILHSKIYFMRAPARQRKYRIKESFIDKLRHAKGVPFFIVGRGALTPPLSI